MKRPERIEGAIIHRSGATLRSAKPDALKENLSDNERHFFAEEMVDVTSKMVALDTRNKGFLSEINKRETYITLFAILVGSVLLGVNLKGIRVPRLK